jgi:carboxybiotin decarboxylase
MKKFLSIVAVLLMMSAPSLFAQEAEAAVEATNEATEQVATDTTAETTAEVAAAVVADEPQESEHSTWDDLVAFFKSMGFMRMTWQQGLMLLVSFLLLYLAIKKQYEPLLLLPIAFGMLLTNLPGAGMFHNELWTAFLDQNSEYYLNYGQILKKGGLLDVLYIGVKAGVYPCLIFIGVGAMTDFGPLIANPKSLLLGAAAQLGIFITFLCANWFGFTEAEAGSIGIIGGADGPTSIFLTSKLAPHLLGPIAIAAYSYMALVPVIQPPIMRALTTKKERAIKMRQLRSVSKTEKIVFPIIITAIVALMLPDAAPLIGCLMLGNLMKECGVVDRLSKTAQNELMNIVVIFLGLSVGATATAESFLNVKTLLILAMGIVAFGFGTAGGVLLAKFMNLFSKDKINPLIGSAGVSAVPMAARVSQTVGQEENPGNFLLMHAMGPNVAGVIGSAVAAGILLTVLG